MEYHLTTILDWFICTDYETRASKLELVRSMRHCSYHQRARAIWTEVDNIAKRENVSNANAGAVPELSIRSETRRPNPPQNLLEEFPWIGHKSSALHPGLYKWLAGCKDGLMLAC